MNEQKTFIFGSAEAFQPGSQSTPKNNKKQSKDCSAAKEQFFFNGLLEKFKFIFNLDQALIQKANHFLTIEITGGIAYFGFIFTRNELAGTDWFYLMIGVVAFLISIMSLIRIIYPKQYHTPCLGYEGNEYLLKFDERKLCLKSINALDEAIDFNTKQHSMRVNYYKTAIISLLVAGFIFATVHVQKSLFSGLNSPQSPDQNQSETLHKIEATVNLNTDMDNKEKGSNDE